MAGRPPAAVLALLLALVPAAAFRAGPRPALSRRTSRDNHLARTGPVAAARPPNGVKDNSAIVPAWLPSFAVPALGGAVFGFDIGAASAVVRILADPAVAQASLGSPLSEIELGNVASLPLFGGMISSAVIAAVGDRKLGRLAELRLASVLYGAATVTSVLAPSLGVLLAGRFVTGLGLGVALHAAPLYIAECAPPELRGRLVAYKEAAIVTGIVLGYAAGAVTGDAGEWRQCLLPAAALESAMLFLSLPLPESPRWLALRGREGDAADALEQLLRLEPKDAARQAKELMPAQSARARGEPEPEPESPLAVLPQLWSNQVYRDALVIGCGLVLFQQLSGQPSVLYYANRLLESVGLGFVAAVGVGGFKLVSTVFSAQLVESAGRRPLLLAGTAGMSLSLMGLSVLYATAGSTLAAGGAAAAGTQAAVIALLFLYVGCYQIGFGPITWLILSEVFPLAVRSPAVSIGTLLNFGSNYFVGTLFELERASLGEPVLFGSFAVVALASTVFVFTKVPETRGLTLEEIEGKISRREL